MIIGCQQKVGRNVEYNLAEPLNAFEELPDERHPLWEVVVADIAANPAEYDVRRGCACEPTRLTILHPDRIAAKVTKVLAAKIPDVDWKHHSATAVVAARLIATAHGLGGAVVAYDVKICTGKSAKIVWHWIDHASAMEWHQSRRRDRSVFGKYSDFFQTSPWLGAPAAIRPAQEVVPTSHHPT
ncbi:hypothetical protein BC832DRAFT_592316 [Gaertneriomyces semiglobifer]|nr:hypothetical protein BC832DRAFT_592316 [Gaertneriomyces semiglobifer]